MTINLRVLLVLAMAMLALPGAIPSFAQVTVAPQAAPAERGREALDVAVSVIAAYDSDVAMEAPTAVKQFFGPSSIGHSNQLVANANYRWQVRDVQVRASGTSAWIQDRQSGAVSDLSHTGAAGLTARLPRRTALLVNYTATYSPSSLYNLFPRTVGTGLGEAPPAAQDYGANDFESLSYSMQSALTHDITRPTSVNFSATGDHALTRQRGAPAGQSELGSYGLSGRFTRAMARNTRARFQYFYRAGSFPDAILATANGMTTEPGVQITEKGVEIGGVYSRPLSATRRIVFEGALGKSVVTPAAPRASLSRRDPTVRSIGQVGVTYQFDTTWQAGAMYRRRIDYVPGLIEPVLTDGFAARIGGFFTRRVEAVLETAYANGASALSRGGLAFDTYTSDAKLRVGLAPAVSVHVEYLYYLYDFRRYAPLPSGMPPALERNGLRAGLTLSIPPPRR